ncbi:helix-turn-helix domain-containing protein [Candidatus Margulisiibacteriota bacterium]
MIIIMHTIITFGAILAFLMAIPQFLMIKRHIKHLVLALLFSSLAYLEFILSLIFKGEISNYSYLIFTEIPFYFCMIACLYVAFENLIQEDYNWKGSLIHFIPTLVSLIALPFLVIKPTAYKIALIQGFFLLGEFNILSIAYAIVSGFLFIYIFLFIIKNKLIPNIFIFIIAFILVLLLELIAIFSGKTIFFQSAASLASLILIFSFISNILYPNSLNLWIIAIQKKRYERSLLDTINKDNVLLTLKNLMEKDKIFQDENLSLQTLAEKLEITAHQLSQLLNETYNNNFNTHINKYRIQEAKKQLIEKPYVTVLAVGFDAGFCSSSVFHNAFKKEIGLTPHQYRQKHLG